MNVYSCRKVNIKFLNNRNFSPRASGLLCSVTLPWISILLYYTNEYTRGRISFIDSALRHVHIIKIQT